LRSDLAGQSTKILARNGTLLREVRGTSGMLSRWVKLREVPFGLKEALIAVEDRHFYSHPGVDPLGVVRATAQALWTGRVVSGASTLTMQLARNLRPHRRNLFGKLQEMALALRIEASLNKDQILEQYLNRIDFGPNLRGVAAAAQGYFGKPVSALSLGESALLAGLPQSPSAYAFQRHPERAVKRQSRVLDAMLRRGRISASEIEVARREQLTRRLPRASFGAPHFVSALIQGEFASVQEGLSAAETRRAVTIRSTIDPELQRASEATVSRVLAGLREHQVSSASVIVVENATGEVLAYVGSPSFYDDAIHGQVDGVRAKRQPGSTLKPFLYASAFQDLGYTAATVVPDLELSLNTESGSYTPRNFDDKFHGPVRVREALGNSLNVPAVHTASRLGAARLLSYLHKLGFASLDKVPEFYGPALALGDGEVTLLELTRAYVTLARGGRAIPLRVVLHMAANDAASGNARDSKDSSNGEGEAGMGAANVPAGGGDEGVIPLSVASVITDILKDPTARQSSFGIDSALKFDFDVAAKTGTSKGYRDNWVVGYSSNFTVGVWVGNFDGKPMLKVGGVTGAAPIFRSILEVTNTMAKSLPLPLSNWDSEQNLAARFGVKRVEICPLSGELRGPHCPHGLVERVGVAVELPTCQWHRLLMLDRRNGKLAGPACPSKAIRVQAFEVLPEEYRTWARSVGRTLAPDVYSPNCEAEDDASQPSELSILYPEDGARFVIDPERELNLQELSMEARVPRGTTEIRLLVDGHLEGKYRAPFEPQFRLKVGQHQLELVSDGGQKSQVVTVEVRAADGP